MNLVSFSQTLNKCYRTNGAEPKQKVFSALTLVYKVALGLIERNLKQGDIQKEKNSQTENNDFYLFRRVCDSSKELNSNYGILYTYI